MGKSQSIANGTGKREKGSGGSLAFARVQAQIGAVDRRWYLWLDFKRAQGIRGPHGHQIAYWGCGGFGVRAAGSGLGGDFHLRDKASVGSCGLRKPPCRRRPACRQDRQVNGCREGPWGQRGGRRRRTRGRRPRGGKMLRAARTVGEVHVHDPPWKRPWGEPGSFSRGVQGKDSHSSPQEGACRALPPSSHRVPQSGHRGGVF
jgi:hypothetical protein